MNYWKALFPCVLAFVLTALVLPERLSAQGNFSYTQRAAPPLPNQVAPQTNLNEQQPGVARASYISGDVSSQRDNGELVPLTLIAPLEAGDRVYTSNNGRAEIRLDGADVLRLSENSTAKIADISSQRIGVQLDSGLITYSILMGAEASVEIDTPNASLHPTTPGEFRMVSNSDDNTQIVIRRGAADVSTPEGSVHVDAGQMITVQGTDNPQYKIDAAPAPTSWDIWNDQRDEKIENAIASARNYKSTNRNYSPRPYGSWFVYGRSGAWWPGLVYGYPGYPVWAPPYFPFFGWGGGWRPMPFPRLIPVPR